MPLYKWTAANYPINQLQPHQVYHWQSALNLGIECPKSTRSPFMSPLSQILG